MFGNVHKKAFVLKFSNAYQQKMRHLSRQIPLLNQLDVKCASKTTYYIKLTKHVLDELMHIYEKAQ